MKKVIKAALSQKVALIMLALFSAFYIFQCSILGYYLPDLFRKSIKGFFLAYFSIRGYINWASLPHKQQTISFIALLTAFISTAISKDTIVLQIIILALGIVEINKKKIARVLFYSTAITLATTIFLSLINIVPDEIYGRIGAPTVRHSLGFQFTTYAPVLYYFASIFYFYSRERKIKLLEVLIVILGASLFFILTNTRLTFIFSIATCIAVYIASKAKNNRRSVAVKTNHRKIIIFFLILFIAIISNISILVPSLRHSETLNNFFSGRLIYKEQAIENYGSFSLFGKSPTIQGVSNYSIRKEDKNRSDFIPIDNIYLFFSLSYGVIGLLTQCFLLAQALESSLKERDFLFTVFLLFFILQCTIDNLYRLDYSFFSILIYVTAFTKALPSRRETNKIGIKEIHDIQLRMLEDFAKYCDANKIRYSLCGGTLLGAIRHKGFIPWDDDIDILVPRPDFERLQKITILSTRSNLKISNETNNSPFPFIKIYNPRYEVYEENSDIPGGEYIWLDVFPCDALPQDDFSTKKLFARSLFWRKLLMQRFTRNDKIISGSKSYIKSLIKPLTKFFADFIPASYYTKRIASLCRAQNYNSSNYVGGLMWGYGSQEKMKKVDFEKRTLVDFEGKKFYTFSCWDSYLKNLYGDYMKLPPKKKRTSHNILIIKK